MMIEVNELLPEIDSTTEHLFLRIEGLAKELKASVKKKISADIMAFIPLLQKIGIQYIEEQLKHIEADLKQQAE